MNTIDIHPHIISDDEKRYPPAPLFGTRSDWSQERPSTVEALIQAMDEAGVARAAVVHSSTTYGFDNSYVVDGSNRYKDRLVAVGSVDMLADDVAAVIRGWAANGLAGLRIFTGGSTKDFDPGELGDPRSFKAWEVLAELGLPICIQTGPIGLPQVTMLAKKFPTVNIILDHLGRPDVLDGPPYANAASLFELAELPNIHLKTLIPKQAIGLVTGVQQVATSLAGGVAASLSGWLLHVGGNYDLPMMVIFAFLLIGAATTAILLRPRWSPRVTQPQELVRPGEEAGGITKSPAH